MTSSDLFVTFLLVKCQIVSGHLVSDWSNCFHIFREWMVQLFLYISWVNGPIVFIYFVSEWSNCCRTFCYLYGHKTGDWQTCLLIARFVSVKITIFPMQIDTIVRGIFLWSEVSGTKKREDNSSSARPFKRLCEDKTSRGLWHQKERGQFLQSEAFWTSMRGQNLQSEVTYSDQWQCLPSIWEETNTNFSVYSYPQMSSHLWAQNTPP